MNSINLLGRLARDPQIFAPVKKDGTMIAKFTLAVRRDEETADFIPCTAFGQTAAIIEDHCKKGQQVAISGRLHSGSYEKDGQTVYTLEVIVDRFYFASQRQEDEAKGGYADRMPGRSRARR